MIRCKKHPGTTLGADGVCDVCLTEAAALAEVLGRGELIVFGKATVRLPRAWRATLDRKVPAR